MKVRKTSEGNVAKQQPNSQEPALSVERKKERNSQNGVEEELGERTVVTWKAGSPTSCSHQPSRSF